MFLTAMLTLAFQLASDLIKASIVKTATGYQLMRGTQKYFIKGVGGTSRIGPSTTVLRFLATQRYQISRSFTTIRSRFLKRT